MRNKGWTKLYREQFNHWISKKPFCDGYAWTYLCNQSNHKKGMVNFRNEYIEIERGQIITSKMKLENIFGWTRRHVDNFLKALENDEMITYRMTNRYTSITIINYENYQSNGKQNAIQNDKQITDRLQTDNKQVSINKNDKNVNNDKNGKKKERDSAKYRTIIREQIINYLNTEASKNYKLNTPITIRLINARLKEGYLLDDFKKVIDIKIEEWKGRYTKDGKNMEDWLRPQTLFGNKFESYLNQNDRSSGLNDLKNDHRFDDIEDDKKKKIIPKLTDEQVKANKQRISNLVRGLKNKFD